MNKETLERAQEMLRIYKRMTDLIYERDEDRLITMFWGHFVAPGLSDRVPFVALCLGDQGVRRGWHEYNLRGTPQEFSAEKRRFTADLMVMPYYDALQVFNISKEAGAEVASLRTKYIQEEITLKEFMDEVLNKAKYNLFYVVNMRDS